MNVKIDGIGTKSSSALRNDDTADENGLAVNEEGITCLDSGTLNRASVVKYSLDKRS